jgi:hypothetical protein
MLREEVEGGAEVDCAVEGVSLPVMLRSQRLKVRPNEVLLD